MQNREFNEFNAGSSISFFIHVICVAEQVNKFACIWKKKKKNVDLAFKGAVIWSDASLPIRFSERDGTDLKRSIALAVLYTTNITLKCFSGPTRFNQMQSQS